MVDNYPQFLQEFKKLLIKHQLMRKAFIAFNETSSFFETDSDFQDMLVTAWKNDYDYQRARDHFGVLLPDKTA